jgi:hypothetical protein
MADREKWGPTNTMPIGKPWGILQVWPFVIDHGVEGVGKGSYWVIQRRSDTSFPQVLARADSKMLGTVHNEILVEAPDG